LVENNPLNFWVGLTLIKSNKKVARYRPSLEKEGFDFVVMKRGNEKDSNSLLFQELLLYLLKKRMSIMFSKSSNGCTRNSLLFQEKGGDES